MKKDKNYNWKGEQIPENEPNNKEIFVWEITPHFNPNFDTLWVRDWYEMQDMIFENLPYMLEDVPEEWLKKEPWNLTFKLVKTTVGEYHEMMAISEQEGC